LKEYRMRLEGLKEAEQATQQQRWKVAELE
jgi:hypothetical protein